MEALDIRFKIVAERSCVLRLAFKQREDLLGTCLVPVLLQAHEQRHERAHETFRSLVEQR
jgi:hypothetical protein